MTINLKKKLSYGLNILFSLGSALTLGLLSFGGLYAIYPSISLGIDSFLLASLYEGQIYFQNIRDAFRKLTDPNYYDKELAGELINQLLEENKQQLIDQIKIAFKQELSDISDEEKKQAFINEKLDKNNNQTAKLPLFFKDYQNAANTLKNISLAKPGSRDEEKAQERLNLIRHYFYKALTGTLKQDQAYAKNLKNFLENKENNDKFKFQQKLQTANTKKKFINVGVYFSITSSALMSIGSVYLILETLATLSFITLPLPIILGMSLICGISYGYLTFNSLSDMIWNESVIQWYFEVKDSVNEAITNKKNIGKAIALSLGSVLLISLATCLTIFTAGTWWTIAKDLKELPKLIQRIPKYVTQILIPSITATATLVFTLENTKSSLDLILKLFNNLPEVIIKFCKQIYKNTLSFFTDLNNNQTPLYQHLNPFNFLLYCIEKPLKILGFTAHIGSVAVTTSRIPHVPIAITVLFAFLSEFFEDLHYFFFSKEEDKACCGHDHTNDIPSKFITILLSPLKMLSYAWHSKGTHWFTQPDGFYNAFQSTAICQRDNPTGVCQDPNCSDANCMQTSTDCQQQMILMQLGEKKESLEKQAKVSTPNESILINAKIKELQGLSSQISNINIENIKRNSKLGEGYKKSIKIREKMQAIMEIETPKLSKHRNFWDISSKTNSQELIDSLKEGIEQLPRSHSTFMSPFV